MVQNTIYIYNQSYYGNLVLHVCSVLDIMYCNLIPSILVPSHTHSTSSTQQVGPSTGKLTGTLTQFTVRDEIVPNK